MNMVKKLVCGIMCLAAMSAVVDAQAAVPKVKVAGDTITVTVPDGTASGTNRLVLCWGATDAGSEFVDWGNSLILSEDVTSTGGVWTVSAAAKGIAANSALRAFIGIPYKVVNYIESTTGTAGGGGNASDKTLAIKTGIAAKTGLHVKTKMRWLALADTDFCGGRRAPGDSTRIFPVHIYNNMWFLGYGSSTANSVACSKDVDYEVETKLYLGSQTMSVDGSQIYSLSDSTAVDTTGDCAAFAVYYPTLQYPIGCVSHARCYYLKMWENGNTTDNPEGDLVRDFIPVKDSLGHGALYDQVTKRTFQSTYTGADPIQYMAVGDETGDVVYSMDIVSPLMVAGFSSLYVQDGLVAFWDGIENAGAGTHDAGATVWKDIVGGREFALTGVTVDDDRMTFAGSASSFGTLSAADTTSTFVAAKNGTLEIVYRSNTGSGSQVFLQAPATSGIAFGIWETSKILNFSSVSQVNKSAFTFTSGTATNCVSVRYSSGEPVSAIGNDTALGIPSPNYWSYPSGETKTFVGVRASKANNFFAGSIYCIRLYNRQLTDAEIAANHAVDQKRFILHVGSDTLNVTSSAEGIGSPSPEYGFVRGLGDGQTVSVSCGNAVVTNANGSVYSCTGWKTYDVDGTQVSSGSDTSFTYTHSSPAEYCELQWQWEMTSPPTRYVSDGLIAFWDGIQNAGSGVHVDGTNIWRDLVHGYEFSLTGTTVDADRMTFDGTSSSYGTLSATDTTSTFVAAKDGTLEIVYRSETGSGSQILMQSSSASGLAFGIWETTKILPYTSASQTAMQGFAHSSGTATNFVAVRYASSSPVSALANGSQLGSSGSSTWSNPGNVTVIGHRYSKENLGFNGSIYAIRLYSRRLTDMEIIDNQTVDQQRFSQSVDNSRLVISSTPEGAGRPSPADGYVTGLAAGDTRIVTCGGAITWTNAAGRVFACMGWKLYDANDEVVDSGSTLSFVYTHPTPAAFRRLEWQWEHPMAILPIPDQVNESFDSCRPQFVVSNLVNGSTWTLGGDIVSPDFDVEYEDNYNPGVATVTVTGKGEYEWVDTSASFNVIATKREDENVSTTDTSARRTMVNGNYVYVFTNAAAAQVVTAKRGIVLSDCLLVGGGGGGGHGRGGGGGGGGGVTNAVDIVGAYIDTDENFTVAVGAGGAGSVLTSSKGGNGGATSLEFGLFSATVAGGGGGGSWGSTAGADGGSGGGGAQAGAGGKGIDGIGHAGANGYGGNSAMSGGGGGAGHAGYAGYAVDANSRFAGNGGEGVTNDITGVDVVYGGGGGSGGAGAGTWWKCDAGLGGLGGGGDGGKAVAGGNGVDGLGGGGGGGTDGSGVNVTDKCGGNGGVGTAILVVRPLVYVIVPIPDQIHESFDPCRPEFVVSNRVNGATWTVGGDIVSPYFDVEYADNVGIGTASVTIIGKGEYADANYTALYNIIATKYEDDNLSTTDLSSRRVIVDGKSVYVFTNAASAQVVTAKRCINLTDFLVVGGGGGGGCTMAGGGGAGGVTNETGVGCAYVGKGDTFTFTVGAGGAGSVSTSSRGGNGGSTTLEFGALSVKAYGGGGGGCRNNSTGTAGLSGGSGGGGAPNAAGGAGIDGQGFAGAAGGGNNSGKSGGGGGAGHAGYVNVDGHSGYGGEGVSNNITGAWVVYGGGGGGGGAAQALYWKTDAGLGGIGGGGDGGKEDIGLNGVDGLGGGGGGGGAGGSGTGIVNKRGGNGGVGTVIFAVAGADFEVDSIPDQLLAAGVSEPIPVVRSGGTLLVKDEDYTVAYADNDKGGVGTVTISGINGYVGKSVSVGFKITALYFAKPTVASEGDGKSWATAKSVANLFATLGTVDYPCEIWIAAGTVSAPSCTCTLTNCATLAIRGGFAGTETTLDERQPGALTVFDGANTVKCMLTATTYRDAELTLDQLKFYRAKENGFIQTGVGSLKIVDCVVEGNGKDADRIFGRGMNVSGGGAGTLVVSNCVFKGNQRRGGIYTYGGFGIYINTFANALVEDTLFVTNGYALGTVPGSGNCGADGGAGGAMRVIGTPITLRRCNFAGNVNPLWKNSDSGGTVMLSGASGGSVIDHCVFVGNTDRISQQASGDINTGGALAVKLSSATDKVKVTNCTFAYNIAHGHCSAGGISVVTGDVDIDNSVFWKNTRAQVTTVGYGSDVQVQSSGKLSIRNSLVTTLDGTGLVSVNPDNLVIDADSVIAADPKLVTTTAAFDSLLTKTASAIYYNPNKSGIYESLAAMDAHLKSPAGYVVNGGAAGPATTDFSPAIDLGDPEADYSNEPSPNGSRLNAGAYGNTAEASSTAIGQPEANVEVTFPDGMTRPKVTISMGLESGDGYIATVQIYCSTGGVLLANQIWKGVGNGEVLEFGLPYYLTNGDNFNVRVTINAPSATQVEYQKSETVEGSYPPFYGKGGGPNVIHVRTGADCLMNGTSWTDAYPDLATAMASSPDASKTEMWLAVTNNYMEKQATLNSSLIIRGGFTGVENAADERAEGATTRLDGNNVYRTMNFSVAQGATLTVERVVFTHSANSELAKTGAGDLIVRDCWFTDSIQTGSLLGRGIYASGGTARIANCKFTNLIGPADTNNGGGDGICFSSCTAAYVDDCIFVTNGLSQFIRTKVWGARHRGAGVWVDATPAIFRNCRFSANIAAMHESSGYSGTLYFSGASGGSKLINCTVVGNSDSQGSQSSATIVDAGAIVCAMSATNQTLDVENCTVAYNITQGQKTAAGITVIKGTVNVKDSIVYGNVRGLTNIAQSAGADFEVKANGYLNLRYSLVTGMTSNYVHSVNDENLAIGLGVIYDVDPLLATTTNDFWKLFTADGAGVYIANGQRGKCAELDVHPRTRTGYIKDGVLIRDPERVESPTIDAGDPTSDYSLEPSVVGIGGNGGRVNLGFSGNSPEAAFTKRTGSVYYIR